jgi:hypothetical protein
VRIARKVGIASFLLAGLLATPSSQAAESVASADELVARHLDSIGTAQVRQAAKSRVAEGTAEFRILVGGTGRLDGKSALVSEGKKLHFMMKFSNGDYHGERVVSDGSRVQIYTATQQARSIFGEFLRGKMRRCEKAC